MFLLVEVDAVSWLDCSSGVISAITDNEVADPLLSKDDLLDPIGEYAGDCAIIEFADPLCWRVIPKDWKSKMLKANMFFIKYIAVTLRLKVYFSHVCANAWS